MISDSTRHTNRVADPCFDGGLLDEIPPGAMPLVQWAAAVHDPEDPIEIRLIKRKPEAVKTPTDWTTGADLPRFFPELARANKLGWEAYASVNPRVAGKRGDSAVTLARCVWTDLDETSPAAAVIKLAAAGLPNPTLVANSGNGAHVYWRLTAPSFDLLGWSAMQKDLAAFVDGDPAMGNAERLMRLPGFQNYKRDPVPCEIVAVDATLRTDWAELRRIVPSRSAAITPSDSQRWTIVHAHELANNVKRCMSYVAALPPAISGQRGHSALLAAARACVAFALTDRESLDIGWEFNSRCVPPWKPDEFPRAWTHKMADARKRVDAGCKLIGGAR